MSKSDEPDNNGNEPPKRIGLSDMDRTSYLFFGYTILISGAIYILCVDSFLFPLDTLKTIVMSDRGKLRKGSNSHAAKPGIFQITQRIVKKEGIRRFWRGLMISYYRLWSFCFWNISWSGFILLSV
jgi:hypothetical protein